MTEIGIYTPHDYGNNISYFRVDMQIKNIGNATEQFFPYPIAVLDDKNNQYEMVSLESLSTPLDLFPNAVKIGSMYFQKFPDDTQNVKLIFDLRDENYLKIPFEYDFTLKK